MSLRAIPRLVVLRPGDPNETVEAWKVALTEQGPVALALSRQGINILDRSGAKGDMSNGGYVLVDSEGEPDVVLIGTGSELELAVKARELRTAADFANYRRRAEEEKYAGQASANEVLLRKVLGIADDLARALEHVPEDQQASPWVEGVEAIERKLVSALESEGVTAIVAVD